MRRFLLIMVSYMLAGCAAMGMPGSITERVSGFDKTTEILLEPAWVQSGLMGEIKLGLFKTSKMDKDKVILIAVVRGANNFASKESLQFNIDGNMATLESIDSLTNIEMDQGVYNSVAYIPSTNWSSKRYEVTKDFINKIINAKEVWVKVNLTINYVEGKFSKDNPEAARPAFRKFYERVWGTN